MAIKRKFHHRRPGFARAEEVEGVSISKDNPFIVAKDAAGKWSVFHARTGLVVEKLLPPRLMRSKLRLLLWLEDMAREQPEAVAMLGLVESADMLAGEFREYGQALVDWSARYVCI